MSEVKVKITGLEELEQKLRDEAKNVAKRTLRRAEKDAGKIWVDAIEQRAPVKTGFLRTHIEMTSKAKAGLEGSMQVIVGPDKKAFYGIFAEFGTRYQKPNPFMRPAFEATKDDVLQAFVTGLRDELEKLKE